MHACLVAFFLSFTAIPPGRRWFPTFDTVISATIDDDIGLCSTLRTKEEEELLYLFFLINTHQQWGSCILALALTQTQNLPHVSSTSSRGRMGTVLHAESARQGRAEQETIDLSLIQQDIAGRC